ncbi:MAG: hypothetical protein JXB32_19160 [Deltaproteobacteria bacterium]|nr:hypothetical protein [Deltaproteobacteria bacterium]
MFRTAALLPLLAVLLPLSACGKHPCTVYADKLCADLGAGHQECRNARRAAEEPTDEMRAVCEEALRSYDDVLRVLRRAPPAPAPPTTGTLAPAADAGPPPEP